MILKLEDIRRYIKQHVYGERIANVFRQSVKQYLDRMKEAAKTGLKKHLRQLLQKPVNMLVKRLVIK